MHLLHMLLLHKEQFLEHLSQFKFWQIWHFFKQSGHIFLLQKEHFNIHNLQNFFLHVSHGIRQFKQKIFLQIGQ